MKWNTKFKTFEEWSTEAPLTGADWSFLPEEVVQTLIPNFMTNTPAVGGRLTVETEKEIEECIRECESLKENNREFVQFADREPYRIFSEFLQRKGEDPSFEECKDLWENEKMLKVIDIIKNSVRRSRPYWMDDRITPLEGTERFCYSFPSGHAAGSRFIALKLAEKFPHLKGDLLKMSERIAQSRVQAGIHFPSDIKAGMALGECFYKIGY